MNNHAKFDCSQKYFEYLIYKKRGLGAGLNLDAGLVLPSLLNQNLP